MSKLFNPHSLAKVNPIEFRLKAEQLAKVETLAVQRILAEAYLSNAKVYADDIFEYLMADMRRLDIGESIESPHYDSCRLYGIAFQSVDAQRRATLEKLILTLWPTWEHYQANFGSSVGITQLRFLKSVGQRDLLSEAAQRRLLELERKFPGVELRPPEGVVVVSVPAPIEPEAQAKMSDQAWLNAMRRYNDSTKQNLPGQGFRKGGIDELSGSFAERVKEDPKRFYLLAQRFDEKIPHQYISAAISGLADSDAPAEWVFELIRRFASQLDHDYRRGICRSLEKRIEAGVPDDLLDLITDWALHDPDPAEDRWQSPISQMGGASYHNDPHHHGINSNRGVAINAVYRCALKREPSQIERIFQLLEKAADDPSTAVRTCVIESLGPLLNKDDTRTLSIFLQTLEGHPRLLQTSLVPRFVHWTYVRDFPKVRPVIEALLVNGDEQTRLAGARIACLAAFQHEGAKDLEAQVMSGDASDAIMRRGAAQVYARNLEHPDLGTICQERLRQLIHDPDEQVRSHIGDCFQYLSPEHLDDLRAFVAEFLESPSLLLGARHLLNYLVPLAVDEPELALKVTAQILDAVGADVVDIRTARAIIERDLVRLPLTVYTHADDPEMKSQAMELFERLLMMGSREAQQALSDWDRR